MRRWIIYSAVLGLALVLAPVKRTDVGELLPVELVYVYSSKDTLCVQTDTGELGIGTDLSAAVKDLKQTASGEVFLDTADYLIVTEDTVALLPQLWEILRPTTQVCFGVGADAGAVGFLEAHKPGVTLNDIRGGERALPILSRVEERYRLEF